MSANIAVRPTPRTAPGPVLAIEGAMKRFPGVVALSEAAIALRPGSIHALLGENGAGKSTMIKMITGVHRADEGRMLLDGEPVSFANPREAMDRGIAAVHQERNLVPRLSVAENILLERMPQRRGLIDRAALNDEAHRLMEPLDLRLDPRTAVRSLSVAQMQLVEIAKGLSIDARVLVLDEPTASITPHETEALFRLLNDLRDSGVSILFVSHKLEEVQEICDTVTVLRDGRNACASVSMDGLGRADLVRFMIGREEQVVTGRSRRSDAAPILELNDVSTDLGHHGVGFAVRPGEIVGLYGLVGAGRTELAHAIIGDAAVTGGEMRVDGRPVRIGNVAEALHVHGIGYVSEDRKGEGLVLMHSIRSNVAITIWDRIKGVLGWITSARERDAAAAFIERLEVRAPSVEQPVRLLSGGNQQKVSVAKWLAAGVRLLIVDEPSVGVDIQTKAYLHQLIHELVDDGTAVILISSDMPEMLALADRIVVMDRFTVVGKLPNEGSAGEASRRIMECIHSTGASPEGQVLT